MNARLLIVLTIGVLAGCSKAGTSGSTSGAAAGVEIPAYAEPGMSGCDHGAESTAIAKHAWPYPAEARNVRWGQKYQKMKLKLSPNPATFYTATVTWKKGELIEVLDSEVLIRKPRKVVAKHDMYVTMKVWDQGREVEKTIKGVEAGQIADYLFYNSRGFCLILVGDKAAWTKCDLGGSFEGVSAEQPFACDQVWWMKVRKSRVDQGWLPFEPDFMERVPPNEARAAK